MIKQESYQEVPNDNTAIEPSQLRCPRCLKSFSRKDAVSRHLQNNSCKKFDGTRSQRNDQKRRERQKVTIEWKGSKIHLQRELGELWKCPNCNKGFKRDDYLLSHLKGHCTGVNLTLNVTETSSTSTDASQHHTHASHPQKCNSLLASLHGSRSRSI